MAVARKGRGVGVARPRKKKIADLTNDELVAIVRDVRRKVYAETHGDDR
jgi:hypothetical protein